MNANENPIPLELMQPDISSQIKQTTLEELKNWIKNGELQPHHQVRVKNLTWIEARKFPALRPFFDSNTNEETDQPNHFISPPSTKTSASEQIKPEINNAAISKKKPDSTVESSAKSESKPVEPSAVFKAFEKKALAKSKPVERKTKTFRTPLKPQKKSLIVRQTIGFLAGCILMFLLSFGGSYLWVYQLKTPVEIDEKSLPGLASLEDKLTSDKLDLRLKEAAKAQELKDAGNQEKSLQTDISQQVAQLEKQHEARRKTVIENHRNKLKDVDFTATFSFSLAVLLALFLMGRIFYGKTFRTAESQPSLKLPAAKVPESLTNRATDIEEIETEKSQESDTPETLETDNKKPDEPLAAESANQAENPDEMIPDAENSDAAESQISAKCITHQNRVSKFICGICDSNFCDECTKTFGEEKNCCPLCKVACKSLEERTEKTSTPPSAPEEKKKTDLLDLGKDSNFIVYDFPDERPRRMGIIPAFIIAVLFSTAISILWVHKVSPYLENRNKEISQTISPNEATDSQQATNKTANAETVNTSGVAPADEPCIDPETKQPFECNEETRKALYEHTRKVQSVEDSQKAVSEKTSVISGLTSENANQKSPKPNAAVETLKAGEKQQLIKSFGISFAIIFGLLMLSRSFSKDKNP